MKNIYARGCRHFRNGGVVGNASAWGNNMELYLYSVDFMPENRSGFYYYLILSYGKNYKLTKGFIVEW